VLEAKRAQRAQARDYLLQIGANGGFAAGQSDFVHAGEHKRLGDAQELVRLE